MSDLESYMIVMSEQLEDSDVEEGDDEFMDWIDSKSFFRIYYGIKYIYLQFLMTMKLKI